MTKAMWFWLFFWFYLFPVFVGYTFYHHGIKDGEASVDIRMERAAKALEAAILTGEVSTIDYGAEISCNDGVMDDKVIVVFNRAPVMSLGNTSNTTLSDWFVWVD